MEAMAKMDLNSKLICVAFNEFGVHTGARCVFHIVASARNVMVRGKAPTAKKRDQFQAVSCRGPGLLNGEPLCGTGYASESVHATVETQELIVHSLHLVFDILPSLIFTEGWPLKGNDGPVIACGAHQLRCVTPQNAKQGQMSPLSVSTPCCSYAH